MDRYVRHRSLRAAIRRSHGTGLKFTATAVADETLPVLQGLAEKVDDFGVACGTDHDCLLDFQADSGESGMNKWTSQRNEPVAEKNGEGVSSFPHPKKEYRVQAESVIRL
jgi:hypothetical protein